MPRTLVFDVNETLLDLGALDEDIERITGAPPRRWFLELQRLWLVATATGYYEDFPTLIGRALRSVSAGEIADADVQHILDGVVALPAHPEVPDALRRLREAGHRLAVLTNGTLGAVRQQLDHAGLSDLLDDAFSADEVRRYKPAPQPYLHAAARLGEAPADLTLVAAHAWDIYGAHQAGFRTAFVARPGASLVPGWPAPDVQGADLDAVADALLRSP
ncbi:MAG: haloacid dehalogenase type II [Bacteroidota bacterium]